MNTGEEKQDCDNKDKWYITRLDRALKEGMCSRVGAGDCEHAIGLPVDGVVGFDADGLPADEEINSTMQRDKPDDWCWSCWKSYQIKKLRQEVQALEAWQDVAAESNRDVSAYLQKEFPSLDLYRGMPIDGVRKVVDYLTSLKCPPATEEKPVPSYTVTTQETKPLPLPDVSDVDDPFNWRKKALIVPDNFVMGQDALCHAADIVITESGRLLKSRYTQIPKYHEDVPPPYTQMAAVLELLSGDLNHDNVAAAKQILKKIL